MLHAVRDVSYHKDVGSVGICGWMKGGGRDGQLRACSGVCTTCDDSVDRSHSFIPSSQTESALNPPVIVEVGYSVECSRDECRRCQELVRLLAAGRMNQ